MADGLYFVSTNGKSTEVTAFQWHYSYAHAIVSFAGGPAVFATAVWLLIVGELRWYDEP